MPELFSEFTVTGDSREILLWSPDIINEANEGKLIQYINSAKQNYGICESTSLSILTLNNGDFDKSCEEIKNVKVNKFKWSTNDILKLLMLLEIFKYDFKLLTKVFIGKSVKELIQCWYLNKMKKSINGELQYLATGKLDKPILKLHKILE